MSGLDDLFVRTDKAVSSILNDNSYVDTKTQYTPNDTYTTAYEFSDLPVGTYLFTTNAASQTSGVGKWMALRIRKNGAQEVIARVPIDYGGGCCAAKIINVVAGDSIAVAVWHDRGNNTNLTVGVSYIRLR